MSIVNRRGFLAGTAALGSATILGPLSGCGSQASISQDPNELVLWLWRRSTSPGLLEESAGGIPGTDRRLRADYITSFDTKLRTSLAAGAYIPDLTLINSNNALYFPSEQEFLDLNELGAAQYEQDFYPWKWALGRTPSDRFCFFPHHTGPSGFFYRRDLFADAGLPVEPDDATAATRSWNEWLELGRKLRRDRDIGLVNSATVVFTQFLNSSAERYFDADDKPLYERSGNAVRQAWDLAVESIRSAVATGAVTPTDQNAAWVSGKTAGHIEGNWWTEVLLDTAPETEGEWRIARQPGLAGSSGGSFIAIPRTCKDPEAAFAWIVWLMTPENQARAFNDVQLFPSSPATFDTGLMKNKDRFFGDQDPLAFFSGAADTVPTSYVSTYESQVEAFTTELTNVATSGKEPERAWHEAVDEVNRVLRKRGAI